MNITLRQLQIFRAIAHTGSTTAAARSIPLSQSAASTALTELEHGVKARLFDRVGKRLMLNDSGRALLPLALSVLDGARSIESAFLTGKDGVTVDLYLAASTTIGNYVLPKLLSSFHALMPATRIDLRISNTLDVVKAVCDFSADLGLIEGPCHTPDVVITPWIEDELVIIAAPTHPLAHTGRGKHLSIPQLRHAPWILREPGSGTREAVEAVLLPHLTNLIPTMTLGSSESIKNSVAEGLGISCLSRSVILDLLATKRISVLATRLPRLTRYFSLIHHRKKTLSDALSVFMRHCQSLESTKT